MSITDKESFKKRILNISRDYLTQWANCKTDINSVVLSYHFTLENRNRNIFIRTTKIEVEENKNFDLEDFFKNMKDTLIDEVLK